VEHSAAEAGGARRGAWPTGPAPSLTRPIRSAWRCGRDEGVPLAPPARLLLLVLLNDPLSS